MRVRYATLLCSIAVALIPALALSEEGSSTNDAALFAAKAKELAAGKNTRVDKIIALQAFVRDEIAQAKTQYG
jgi:hypothetical protein